MKNNKSNVLIVYDFNSNIEMYFGLAVYLSKRSNVTVVDLPGFGGMDSMYKIRKIPSINNISDYLASFIKLRYKNKRLNLLTFGFGSVLAVRCIQNNDSLFKKINNYIFINGYSHHDDFDISSRRKKYRYLLNRIKATSLVSFIIKSTIYSRSFLDYRINKNSEVRKLSNGFSYLKQFLVDLNRENDLRTKYYLQAQVLKLDNCNNHISGKCWFVNVGSKSKGLIPRRIEQHFKIIFSTFASVNVKGVRKIPLIMNDEKIAAKIIPIKIRNILRKS
jgi:hypothetical protein